MIKAKKVPQKGLTKAEGKRLATLLKKSTFPLPKPVFDAWVENLPTVALELAIVRSTPKGWAIFLTKRHATDPFWPNEWHLPGTIIRQNERITVAYRRLIAHEAGSVALLAPQAVTHFEFPTGEGLHRCRRGHEIGLLYLVHCLGDTMPKRGTFFLLSSLPKGTIGHHRTLTQAVKNFLRD